MALQYLLTFKGLDLYLDNDMKICFLYKHLLHKCWHIGTLSYMKSSCDNKNLLLAINSIGNWFIVRDVDLYNSAWNKILTNEELKELCNKLSQNEKITILDILNEY